MERPSTIETKDLFVRLVPPDVWRPQIAVCFGELTLQEQRFARSILATMHDRHIGITPELAAELARLLLDPRAATEATRTWVTIHDHLMDVMGELSTETGQGRALHSKRSPGLLLGSDPIYTVTRLALPIVEKACRQIGRCYLFCADEIDSSVQKDEYGKYTRDLSTEIARLTHDPSKDGGLGLFWKEGALALTSFSHASAIFERGYLALPKVDPSALSLLLDLEPNPSSEHCSQHLPHPSVHHGHRRNPLERGGGIDGVRFSNRETDIEHMLPSEWTYPELIRIDRMINDGFLIFERESKHERARDALFAALMPGQVRATLTADFVKACWFDCIMRFGLLLRQSRLHQSEFRWVEGDVFDRTRTCTFFLQDLPTFQTTIETRPSKPYRHEFLTRLRWLPFYLDTRAHFNPLKEQKTENEKEQDDSPENDIKRSEEWAYAACLGQKDHARWARCEDDAGQRHISSNRLRINEFAFVHVMLFLPLQALQDETAESTPSPRGPNEELGDIRALSLRILSQLHARLGFGDSPGRNVSITWVPDRLQNPWRFDTRRCPVSLLFPGKPPSATEQESVSEKIADRLVQAWLDQWIKEFRRD